jgi:hypothetical protein
MTAESFAGTRPVLQDEEASSGAPLIDVDPGYVAEVPATPEDQPHDSVRIYTSRQPGNTGSRVRALASKLRTDVFLQRKHITPAHVNELGFYDDPYEDQSHYFYVRNTRKEAAARMIHVMPEREQGGIVENFLARFGKQQRAQKAQGIMALPTCKEFQIDHQKLAQAAGVEQVADIKNDEIVEISGLAARRIKSDASAGEVTHGDEDFDAVISLYSKMMRESLEAGHKVWVMNTDEPLIRQFRTMMTAEQVKVIGQPRKYLGAETIPAAISPHAVMREIFGNQDKAEEYAFHIMHLKEVFKGIDARKIPDDIQDLLEQKGVDFTRVEGLRKMSKGELAVHAGIFAYSAARGLPTLAVDNFEGSTAALVGIDLATSIPYSKGMVEMYKNQSTARKLGGAAVALPSFMAPYIYFYAESGHTYPGYVNGFVGGLIGTAVAKEVMARRGRAQRQDQLTHKLETIKGR